MIYAGQTIENPVTGERIVFHKNFAGDERRSGALILHLRPAVK